VRSVSNCASGIDVLSKGLQKRELQEFDWTRKMNQPDGNDLSELDDAKLFERVLAFKMHHTIVPQFKSEHLKKPPVKITTRTTKQKNGHKQFFGQKIKPKFVDYHLRLQVVNPLFGQMTFSSHLASHQCQRSTHQENVSRLFYLLMRCGYYPKLLELFALRSVQNKGEVYQTQQPYKTTAMSGFQNRFAALLGPEDEESDVEVETKAVTEPAKGAVDKSEAKDNKKSEAKKGANSYLLRVFQVV
jgi:hypothetical protein